MKAAIFWLLLSMLGVGWLGYSVGTYTTNGKVDELEKQIERQDIANSMLYDDYTQAVANYNQLLSDYNELGDLSKQMAAALGEVISTPTYQATSPVTCNTWSSGISSYSTTRCY